MEFFEKKEQKKSSIFEKIRAKIGRSLRTLLMASVLLSPLKSTEAKSIIVGDKKNTPDTELPLDTNNHHGSDFFDAEKSDVEKDKNFEKINLSPTFIQTDPETGNKEFNFMSIIAPFDLTISTVENQEYTTSFTIPYEYARLFSEDPNAEKEIDSNDYQLLSNYVKTELQTELNNAFHGFGWSENVYNTNHPGELEDQSIKVEYMRVVGMTSPEGHVSDGKETIIPGNIDEDNIELGHTRANAAERMTLDELKKLGVNTEEIESFVRESGSIENQCTEEEMSELAELAKDYDGGDDIERIFKLYQDYNLGNIKDQSVVDKLDKIIGSKRCVEIEVGLQGQRRVIVAIPIPILLLLPLVWRMFSKKKKEKNDSREPEPTPKEEENELPKQEEVEQEKSQPHLDEKQKEDFEIDPNYLPEKLIKTELPENQDEYREMTSFTVEDLYIGFDNPDNIRLGIDYRSIFEYYYKNYEDFKDIKFLETVMAYKILMSWKMHDIENRKMAGLSNPEEGMDYENNEKQIQWAKMHARQLIEIIKRIKNNALIKNKSELKPEENQEQNINTLNQILDQLNDKQIFEERKSLNEINDMKDRGREDNKNFIVNFLTKTAPSILEKTNTYLINKYNIKELQKIFTDKREEDVKDIKDFKKRFYDNFIDFDYENIDNMEELIEYLEIAKNADRQLSLIESGVNKVKLEQKIIINFRAKISKFLSGLNERIEELNDPLYYLTVEYRKVRQEKMKKWLNE